MLSPSTLTTRRQFLNRSAWGFGSLLVSSSLLQSCINDHVIPDPTNPTHPPHLGDSIDWNEDIKTIVTTGLDEIPQIGTIVSGIIDLVWPGGGNGPWDQVKDQVQALVKKDIDATVYSLVLADLQGLQNSISEYTKAIDRGDSGPQVYQYWFSAIQDFVDKESHFKNADNAVLLLPLFAQFANLYLSLLRDVGQNVFERWGLAQSDFLYYLDQITTKQGEYVKWANDTYNQGRSDIQKNVTFSEMNVEPFQSTNAYDRYMTITVLDYMDTWPYYAPSLWPQGAKNPDGSLIPLFTREIYSDPYGNLVKTGSQTITLPAKAPTQFPNEIVVWSGPRIDAVELEYPAGGGPNGVTATPRMGDMNQNAVAHRVVNPVRNPITQVLVTANVNATSYQDEYISSLQFVYYDGKQSDMFGSKNPNAQVESATVAYTNYAMSSIYIHGTSMDQPNSSSDCIVFGFKRWLPM